MREPCKASSMAQAHHRPQRMSLSPSHLSPTPAQEQQDTPMIKSLPHFYTKKLSHQKTVSLGLLSPQNTQNTSSSLLQEGSIWSRALNKKHLLIK